jgi:hypothetical protein
MPFISLTHTMVFRLVIALALIASASADTCADVIAQENQSPWSTNEDTAATQKQNNNWLVEAVPLGQMPALVSQDCTANAADVGTTCMTTTTCRMGGALTNFPQTVLELYTIATCYHLVRTVYRVHRWGSRKLHVLSGTML